MSKPLRILKLGGDIVDDSAKRNTVCTHLLEQQVSYVLVHGGGKVASDLSVQLGVLTEMVDGRRITDAETLRIVTMVYAGLINKTIVADLQALGLNALGLSGVDADLLRAHKREVSTIDYGFVGDIDVVNTALLLNLIELGIVPVVAPITHDGAGQLLNTNADSVASRIALALSAEREVEVLMLMEKEGVLRDPSDDSSLMDQISEQDYLSLRESGHINSGMIAKLDNAFELHRAGISVRLCSWRTMSGGTCLVDN